MRIITENVSMTMLLLSSLFYISMTAQAFLPTNVQHQQYPTFGSTCVVVLKMAGFGGGGGSSGGGKKTKSKKKTGGGKNRPKKGKNPTTVTAGYKPKQQWDRYSDLKREEKVRVAVKIVGDNDNNEWLEVGRIKTKDNAYSAIAVALQRALIAEVSFPPRC